MGTDVLFLQSLSGNFPLKCNIFWTFSCSKF